MSYRTWRAPAEMSRVERKLWTVQNIFSVVMAVGVIVGIVGICIDPDTWTWVNITACYSIYFVVIRMQRRSVQLRAELEQRLEEAWQTFTRDMR